MTRWKRVLDGVHSADIALWGRLRHRLVGSVQIHGRAWRGDRAAVWTETASSIDLLANQVLTAAGPSEVVGRTGQWLATQPPIASWIVDDAGVRDSRTGDPVTTVAVANVTDAPLSCSVLFAADGTPQETPVPELISLEAGSVRQVQLRGTLRAGTDQPSIGRTLLIRHGSVEHKRIALCQAIPVRPPGLPIGPFLPQIDPQAASEQEGQPSVATVGLLQRDDERSGSERRARTSAWTLYLESGSPREAVSGDHIEIWIGPFGAPSQVLVVWPDGRSIVRSGSAAATTRTAQVRTERSSDRWVCWVSIPPECIETDGLIRMGAVRVLGDGPTAERLTWPRAILPWQVEPGRLLLDTNAW